MKKLIGILLVLSVAVPLLTQERPKAQSTPRANACPNAGASANPKRAAIPKSSVPTAPAESSGKVPQVNVTPAGTSPDTTNTHYFAPCLAIFFGLVLFALAVVYSYKVFKFGTIGNEDTKATKAADEESRKMYHETFRTLITAAALAIPIIAATLRDHSTAAHTCILRWAVIFLLLTVVLAIVTLLEMSRHYERARTTKADLGRNQVLQDTVANIKSDLRALPPNPEDPNAYIVAATERVLPLALGYLQGESDPRSVGIGQSALRELCILACATLTLFGWGLICVAWFVWS
jgi:hypothetical protein